MNNIDLNKRIVFALDFNDPEEAKKWVVKLDKHIKHFKVGLELFLSSWWDVVDFITQRGNEVMLDLKFFDIPETVHLAIQQIKSKGVGLTTIHGNESIIKAALKNKDDLKILAVTVLTSFDERAMRDLGMSGSVQDMVIKRAVSAFQFGCAGVVSSPLEAKKIRQQTNDDFIILTPGIRPSLDSIKNNIKDDDQKRITNAEQAILNGSDYIVVGRPIKTAKDPIAIIDILQKEIYNGLEGLGKN
jgi:orotidine-5'-phosphate decarboxylase